MTGPLYDTFYTVVLFIIVSLAKIINYSTPLVWDDLLKVVFQGQHQATCNLQTKLTVSAFDLNSSFMHYTNIPELVLPSAIAISQSGRDDSLACTIGDIGIT